jgi:hypothetical protein
MESFVLQDVETYGEIAPSLLISLDTLWCGNSVAERLKVDKAKSGLYNFVAC